MSNKESITKEVLNVLTRHIDNYMTFRDIIEGWPESNRKLKYPCLSATVHTPEFRPCPPYQHSIKNPDNDSSEVYYVVGDYDFKIQLDLWCRNKEERHDKYDQLFNALNTQLEKGGLSLQLERYHGVMAHYVFSGYNFTDDEATSQRKEWRATVNLMVTTVAISSQKQYIITQEPELNFEISDNPL